MGIRNIKHKLHILKRTIVDGFILRGYRSRFSNVCVLEATNVCSLKCSCCPNGVTNSNLRQHGMMNRETFDKFMSQLDMPIKKCYLHMCGEPLLNKSIIYFANTLLERNITPVFFSNGYKIDTTLLDNLLKLKRIEISFSMDILSKEHYEAIRTPGKFDIAKDSLLRINQVFAQNNKYYGLNIIISPESLRNIGDTCEQLFREFSHLRSISLSSLWPWPGLPTTGFLAGHIKTHSEICARYRDLPVVLWNGDVSFCSFDYSGRLVIGNIHNESYSHICNNDKARRIRRNLLMRRYRNQEFCNACLLYRYQPFDMILLRNKYLKMTHNQRAEFEKYLRGYYES